MSLLDDANNMYTKIEEIKDRLMGVENIADKSKNIVASKFDSIEEAVEYFTDILYDISSDLFNVRDEI